jgi:Uma2 family endonuclease
MTANHNVTVEELRRLKGGSPLAGQTRPELLDGEVVKVPVDGPGHAGCLDGLAELLVAAVGDRAVISVQSPIQLDARSKPRPDVALLRPRPEGYDDAPATAGEIILLIEVSDTTLIYDRGRKASHYARAGIPECWVVDLAGEQVLVMRTPASAGYRDVRTLRRGATLWVGELDGVAVCVADVLGPAAV